MSKNKLCASKTRDILEKQRAPDQINGKRLFEGEVRGSLSILSSKTRKVTYDEENRQNNQDGEPAYRKNNLGTSDNDIKGLEAQDILS